MDGGPGPEIDQRARDEQARLAAVVSYYEHATVDYGHWARGHMHFGYWRPGLRAWRREPMIAALSAQVHARLELDPDEAGPVADLGCGVGEGARQLVSSHARVRALGVTLVPGQIALGRALNERAGMADRIELLHADYRALPVATASLAGAYAIESTCYDPEGGAGVIREAARALRPGARLVVADAFVRRAGPLPKHARACVQGLSDGWVLPGLPRLLDFNRQLRASGFEAITIEDLSLHVLPSLLHVPATVLRFRLREGPLRRLDPRREGNVWAPVWALASALLAPRWIGYYVISARAGLRS